MLEPIFAHDLGVVVEEEKKIAGRRRGPLVVCP